MQFPDFIFRFAYYTEKFYFLLVVQQNKGLIHSATMQLKIKIFGLCLIPDYFYQAYDNTYGLNLLRLMKKML